MLTIGRTVEVGDADAVEAEAESDRLAALSSLRRAPVKAWLSWKNAVRHRPFRKDYRDAHDSAMRSAIASCYPPGGKVSMTTLLGQRRSSPDCGGIMMHRRSWPWRVRSRRPWSLRGDALWASEDLEEAYQAFKTSIELDPRRSWARRKAEDVRDLRLKITRPGRKKKGGRR